MLASRVHNHALCRKQSARHVCRTAQVDRTSSPSHVLSGAMKEAFKRDGFVLLKNIFSDAELKKNVDTVYYKFLSGEIAVSGKDRSDASAAVGSNATSDFKEYAVQAVRLPRNYYPQWQGNVVEATCQKVAEQLLETEDVELDYDTILATRPKTKDSALPWHQDAAAWPEEILGDVDCASTLNCWVAVTDVPLEAGCLRFVPGSHKEASLRRHQSVGAMLRADVGGERAVLVPMQRGDVIVYDERTLNGSGSNWTNDWKCGYILNYKRSTCVMHERELGITHSMNDSPKLQKIGEQLQH